MKKRCLLCFLISVLFLCAGCTPQSGPQSPAASIQADIPTLIWWTVGPEPVDFQLGMDNINRYLEAEMGLRLDMRMLPFSELMDKTLQVCSTGEYFDIMFVDFTNYNKFSTWGSFCDITDRVRAVAPELWEFIPNQVWAGTKIDGRIYAVPTYKDVSLTQYWVFEGGVLEESGVDITSLHDWDDLDAALRQVKETKGDAFYPVLLNRDTPFNGVFAGYDRFGCGLPVVGVRIEDENRQVRCVLEDPQIMSRLRMLHQWYETGIINPDANIAPPQSNMAQPFFAAVGWPGAELIWQRNRGVEVYKSQAIYGPVLSSETIQGSLNAISSQSAYQNQALQLLQRINLDPVLRDMFAYGVEGTHFEYVGDRVVRQLNKNWNVEVFAQGTFFTMSTTTEWPANQWALVKAQNEKAESSVLLGFSMDISELSTEISGCKAVWDKYSLDLLTGVSDPEVVVPQCIDELRQAGMDIILSEAQKQIDLFADSNAR